MCVGGGEYRLPNYPRPFNVCFTCKYHKCGVVSSSTGSHSNCSCITTQTTPTSPTTATTTTSPKPPLLSKNSNNIEPNTVLRGGY